MQEEQLAIGGKDQRVAAVAPQSAAALSNERRMVIRGHLHADGRDIPWQSLVRREVNAHAIERNGSVRHWGNGRVEETSWSSRGYIHDILRTVPATRPADKQGQPPEESIAAFPQAKDRFIGELDLGDLGVGEGGRAPLVQGASVVGDDDHLVNRKIGCQHAG
jgi:hypothetical protein